MNQRKESFDSNVIVGAFAAFVSTVVPTLCHFCDSLSLCLITFSSHFSCPLETLHAFRILTLFCSRPVSQQPRYIDNFSTLAAMLTTSILAASSFIALGYAFPHHFHVARSTALAPRADYITFGGDGSMSAGWPKQTEWMSFDDAWYVPIKETTYHRLTVVGMPIKTSSKVPASTTAGATTTTTRKHRPSRTA